MLKTELDTNENTPFTRSTTSQAGAKNHSQLNLLKSGRDFMPRPFLLSVFFIASVLLTGIVLIFGITRQQPSSAYRVSYQEYVTNQNGITSSSLYYMKPDGSDIKPLTLFEDEVIKGGVSWSPDGDELVYMRIADFSQPGIERTTWHSLASNELVQITRTDIPQPQWSPDGRYIALTLRGALAIWDIDAEDYLYYYEPSVTAWYHSPVWLHHGQTVLFIARLDNADTLLKLELATGEITSVTDAIPEVQGQRMQAPTIAPNDEMVALILSDPAVGSARIYLMNLLEKTAHPILATPSGQFNPKWSPDSRWLIYNGGFQVGQTGGTVYRVNITSGVTQQLPQSVNTNSGMVWSPDGRWLYYSGATNNTWNIFRSDINGGQVEQLTHSPNAQLFITVSPLMNRKWNMPFFSLIGLSVVSCFGLIIWRANLRIQSTELK